LLSGGKERLKRHCHRKDEVMTKQQLIAKCRNFDFSSVGYGSLQNFATQIMAIPDDLFALWFTLKPGDIIMGRVSGCWGTSAAYVRLEVVRLGDGLVKGDQISCDVKDIGGFEMTSPYDVAINHFGGIVRRKGQRDAKAAGVDYRFSVPPRRGRVARMSDAQLQALPEHIVVGMNDPVPSGYVMCAGAGFGVGFEPMRRDIYERGRLDLFLQYPNTSIDAWTCAIFPPDEEIVFTPEELARDKQRVEVHRYDDDKAAMDDIIAQAIGG
jgi:hypothetical protein